MKKVVSHILYSIVWAMLAPFAAEAQGFVEQPEFSQDAATPEAPAHWYYVGFDADGRVLVDRGQTEDGANQRLNVTEIYNWKDAFEWCLVQTGAADAGTFVLKSKGGNYVAWDNVAKRFTSTPSREAAAVLVKEQVQNEDGTAVAGSFCLKLTGTDEIPYMMISSTDTDQLTTASAGGDKCRLRFYTPMVTPKRVTEQPSLPDHDPSTPWYSISFTVGGGSCILSSHGPGNPLYSVTLSQRKFAQKFVLIDCQDYDRFLLMGRYGLYVRMGDNERFTCDFHSEGPVSFRLLFSLTGTAENRAYKWQIQRDGAEEGKCMNAWAWVGIHTGCQFGEWTKGDGGNMVEFKPSTYIPHKVRVRESAFVEKCRNEADDNVRKFFISGEEGYGFDTNPYTGERMQKTNTFSRVHYMKPGEQRYIPLPTIMRGQNTRDNTYQRWYNYITGGPVESYWLSLADNAKVKQFDNGTVMGEAITVDGGQYYVGQALQLTMQRVDKYILAADVSRYYDLEYDPANSDADMTEPTLTCRYLFEIRNANQMADQLMACPEGNAEDKWLEDYEITCPGRSMSTMQDQLCIQYELQDYWFRRKSDNELQNIDGYERFACELDTESGHADVKSVQLHVNGDGVVSHSRFFYFDYENVEGIGKYAYIKIYAIDNSVAGGTPVRYQLARIRLNFLANSGARPAVDIVGRNANGTYKSMRSPEFMQALCGEPVASINFNDLPTAYESPKGGINIGGWTTDKDSRLTVDNTYAYPLRYEDINYGYCPSDNLDNSSHEPGWGQYSLVKKFRGVWHSRVADMTTSPVYEPVEQIYNRYYGPDSEYPDPNYVTNVDDERFLFIDASEEPGIIARLEFNGNLCMGSRLYCSAWLASPNDPDETRAPASVLFQFIGYRDKLDDNGNPIEGEETAHQLHTFYSGQITSTGWTSDMEPVTYGPDNNYRGIWQQVAFSFIPDRRQGFYKRYALVIYNNCYDSEGGDILLDNVKVFAAKPSVNVEQTAPFCEQTLQLMKMSCRFQDLLSAMGLTESAEPASPTDPNDPKLAELLYCFLDAEKYDKCIGGTAEEQEAAFYDALLGSTDPADRANGTYAYHSIKFSTCFADDAYQPLYANLTEVPRGGAQLFREIKQDGLRYFVLSDQIVDTKIEPGRRYYMVAVPRNRGRAEATDPSPEAWQIFDASSDCSIRAEFIARASSVIKLDGDANLVVNDEINYCVGNMPTIEVVLTYATLDGSEGVYRGQIHDWWYGRLTNEEGTGYNDIYVADASDKDDGKLYLSEAMALFRHYYPDVSTLDDVVPQEGSAADPGAFTQQMIELIRKYVDYGLGENLQLDENGLPLHPYLILHRSTMNVPLASDVGATVYLTVIPIEEKEIEDKAIVCYEPKEIPIHLTGRSPGMFVGLQGYTYPSYINNTPLRVMLPQIRRTQQPEGKAVDLQLPINRKDFVMNSSAQMTMHRANPAVYLAGTDDPAYFARMTQMDAEGRDIGLLTIGEVRSMTVPKDGDSYVNIRFDEGFLPREGYTYTLKMWFEEDAGGATTDNAGNAICEGTIVLDMKVVPEYEVWIGSDATNDAWTNDGHWARADATQLYAGRGGLDGYLTNEANTTANGFVPMRYTKVIIPKRAGTDAPLSPACYPGLVDVTVSPGDNKDFYTFRAEATPDIAYDMVVRTPEATAVNQTLFCERFEPYVADSVQFQPGAELMRADRLTYNAAAVEYELTPGRWYTLASPLQGMYAGDWYAPSQGGRQETTYFVGISYDPAANHRFKPAVYQRSWDKSRSTAKVYRLNTAAAESEDVAMVADWSQVYNDVEVPYDLSGFSVKVDVGHMDAPAPAATLFRFPKADTQYTYYAIDNSTDGRIGSIGNRTDLKSHRLYSDYLRDEAGLYVGTNSKVLTHTFEVAADAEQQYHLVSNPFVCGLDMEQFFARNTWLEPKYWCLTAGGQQVSMRNEATGGWVSVGGTTGSGNIVAPLQAFFVKRKAEAAAAPEVQFTVDMMGSALANGVALQSRPRREAAAAPADGLRITAMREGYASSALVLSATAAHNGYLPGEDAATLFDSNTPNVPTVYTLSGGHALTINALQRVSRLPIGVESTSADAVTLRFEGVADAFSGLMLYDASTGDALPLYSGAEVEVPGRTAGRYFLVTEALPAEEIPHGILVEVDRAEITLSASSGDPLLQVSVTDAGGRCVYAARPDAATHTFSLQKGVYIVKAATARETLTRKVILR